MKRATGKRVFPDFTEPINAMAEEGMPLGAGASAEDAVEYRHQQIVQEFIQQKSERDRRRIQQHRERWAPERIRRATSIALAQARGPRPPGKVFGISRGFRGVLTRAGHEYEALGLEILTDRRMTDAPHPREEFIRVLAEYLGSRQARVVFDSMTGQDADRAKKKYSTVQLQERQAYREHLRRITSLTDNAEFLTQNDAFNPNPMRAFVSKTPPGEMPRRPSSAAHDSHPLRAPGRGNPSVTATAASGAQRKTGRPPRLFIIHGEAWRVYEMLFHATISADSLESEPSDFAEGHLKERSDIESMRAYKDYLAAWRVEANRKPRPYSRAQLADFDGLSRSYITTRVTRRGNSVQPNPPKLTELAERALLRIPDSHRAFAQEVHAGIIAPGTHLQDERGHRYRYRRSVARRLMDQGHTVYRVTYAPSTYIPRGIDAEAKDEIGTTQATAVRRQAEWSRRDRVVLAVPWQE